MLSKRILVLFICLSAICRGQINKLKGTWITKDQELILIKDSTSSENDNRLGNKILNEENFEFKIYGDTLSFQKQYTSSRTNYEKMYVDRYDLKIVSLSDTFLVVKPISKHSISFFNNKSVIKFKRQEYSIDSKIEFEKLVFHATGCCGGECPLLNLQIDKSRKLYSDSKHVKGEYKTLDTTISGKREGKLDEVLYNELITLLKTSNLKNLKFKTVGGSSAPNITLIVYFNGQKKRLSSPVTPTVIDGLIKYLYDLNHKVTLAKTDKKIVLEK